MTTRLLTHPACLAHDTGPGHPEGAARLKAVLDALEGEEFQDLQRAEAPPAGRDDLARVHDRAYVEWVFAHLPKQGFAAFDPDTIVSPGSGEAALRAAGAVLAGVDAVLAGKARNAFAAVRPPGHHAMPATAMGFCLFNNIAVGAAYARAKHGLQRLAIVDFDVHHGNSTQAMFEADPDLLYASTHLGHFYPGTGGREERGVSNVLNVPLSPHDGSDAFRAAIEGEILPALEAFRPEFLFLSAGFDAHRGDPLAYLELETDDFAWVTEALCECAARHCGGRIVSTLEGGYNLDDLAASAAAHVGALMRA